MGESLADFFNRVERILDARSEMGDEPCELVQLYVYDLTEWSHASSRKSSCSSGVAGFSLFYHTSIVAFGKEYTFNCTKGITVTPEDHVTDGPDKTHVQGYTRKTENELKKFLEDLGNTFKKENYELFQLNCQEFCKKLCEFLGVEGLPGYVTKIREWARDTFGTQANLERTAVGVAAIAGLGYAAYKGLTGNSENDRNKN